MSKTKGSSMQRKNIGGLGDYIVQKEDKREKDLQRKDGYQVNTIDD